MGTRGRDGFLQRLEKVEKQFIRRLARADTRVVCERLLPVMGRGDPEAVRRALQDLPTWDVLIPTMHPEHVAIVLDTFATGWKGHTGRSSLALAPIHKCEACSYRIPTYIGPGYEKREVYFTECPLCGARIRWEWIRTSDSPVGADGYPLRTSATVAR